MKRYKVAIILDVFANGGVSRVLCDFLKEIKNENFDITIFVRDYHRTKWNLVPDYVELKPWNGKQTIKSAFGTGGISGAIRLVKNLLMIKLCRWNYGKGTVYSARCNNNLDGEFDCAIGYHMIVNDVTVMTLEKIKAKRRILWVHGQKTIRDKDKSFYSKLYSKADLLVCVSKDTENRWGERLPKCKPLMTTVHNCYDFSAINELAREECDMRNKEDETCIVTVGGMFEAKGMDRVAVVAEKLVNDGCKFQWFLVGDGPLRKNVEQQIDSMKLNGFIHVLGRKENPYTYINNCDIYVQPSYSEGYCTTTMEAKILKKPVVTTDVPGMNEQFVSGYDGLIVESSVDGIFNGIKRLIDDKHLYDSIKKNLQNQRFSNEEDVEKALCIIRG